jgi:hypothetical protein
MDTPHPHRPPPAEVDPDALPASIWQSLALETRSRLLVGIAAALVLANPVTAIALWAYSGHSLALAVLQAVLTAGTALLACTAANRLSRDDGSTAASGIIASFALVQICGFLFLYLYSLVIAT